MEMQIKIVYGYGSLEIATKDVTGHLCIGLYVSRHVFTIARRRHAE